jgi:hypothetical protein
LVNASGLFSTIDLAPLQHHLQAPITNFNKLTTGEIKVSETLLKQLETLKIV